MGKRRAIRANYLSLTGVVSIQGEAHEFESSLERDFLLLLCFDFTVTQVITQYGLPDYFHEGKSRRYTPDIFVQRRTAGGLSTTIYEVKYRKDLWQNWTEWRPRYAAANAYCRSQGWRFDIITDVEVRGPYLLNARFFRSFLKAAEKPDEEAVLLALLLRLGSVSPNRLLGEAVGVGANREHLTAALWRLVARGRICANWYEEITMNSLVWVAKASSCR